MTNRPSSNVDWLHKSPVLSDVEAKLRHLLVELGNDDKIIGIQVCAYKDGQVIIDTAAGVMGNEDPRPVQPDTLFPVFSTTKAISAGMIHWLADKGILKLDDYVANFWPEFGCNGKDKIKVHHILNHTSGLHNALAGISDDVLCDWDECLKRIEVATPNTEPGHEQFYHFQSYGWLCGGIVEHASGKKFQDILEEAFVRPLNVEGEFYVGIPPGVESRVATITCEPTEFSLFAALLSNSDFRAAFYAPSSLTAETVGGLICISNTPNFRHTILPGSNGQVTARALARYYAALEDGGTVPFHSSSTLPPLGSHPHNPTLPSKNRKEESNNSHTTNTKDEIDTKIFSNPKSKVHDAFLGAGDYKDLVYSKRRFRLGFWKIKSTDGHLIGFGHSGLGGSESYCDINHRFSIAVTLNKLTFVGDFTGKIVRLVCTELDIPVPAHYAGS